MHADLQRRIQELSDEIRDYPQPIARCDAQLPGLLEQRARLIAELKMVELKAAEQKSVNERGGCTPAATWINDGGFNAT